MRAPIDSSMDAKARAISRTPLGPRILDIIRRNIGVGSTLLLVIIFFAVTQPSFFTQQNILNILRSNTVTMLASLGMTIAILGGGLDLSQGSLAAMSGVMLAGMVRAGVSPGVAICATALAAFVLSYVLNGVFIGRFKFNFIVVTLATASIFRGAALIVSNGTSWSTFDFPLVQFVGDGNVGALPIPVLITAALCLLIWLMLRRLKLGRMIYAVGGNAEAARLSGIDIEAIRTLIYGISGLFAGIAGIILTGRLTSAQPVTGAVGLELTTAAAVLLGGTSFTGGSGGVVGTIIGVLYIGVLQNGLSIAGVQSFWQYVATGVILLLAIGFDRLKGTE